MVGEGGWPEPAELNQGSGWRYGHERRQGGRGGEQDHQNGSRASLFWWRSWISGMKAPVEVTHWPWRTWMTTKKSWPPSLPRLAKTFSIPYVFYAFALCDSDNTDENLNWRNVKQMVPTWFWIREGLKALHELRMLSKSYLIFVIGATGGAQVNFFWLV